MLNWERATELRDARSRSAEDDDLTDDDSLFARELSLDFWTSSFNDFIEEIPSSRQFGNDAAFTFILHRLDFGVTRLFTRTLMSSLSSWRLAPQVRERLSLRLLRLSGTLLDLLSSGCFGPSNLSDFFSTCEVF